MLENRNYACCRDVSNASHHLHDGPTSVGDLVPDGWSAIRKSLGRLCAEMGARMKRNEAPSINPAQLYA
jgi:hypothetical protein